MATTIPSTSLIPTAPVFTSTARLALAGFLAGYSGLTRQAYELDLRKFASWCQQHRLALFAARRADIELFARDLEARGRARATITRRLCTAAGFYRYAVEEELLEHSPPRTCAVPGWTMSPSPTGLAATNSADVDITDRDIKALASRRYGPLASVGSLWPRPRITGLRAWCPAPWRPRFSRSVAWHAAMWARARCWALWMAVVALEAPTVRCWPRRIAASPVR